MAPSPARRRPATIYEVAERAGVSIASVSRVLHDPDAVRATTRDRVLHAVESLNYVPLGAAQSLAVQRHEAHGLILPELSGVYFPELLAGYEAAASDLGQSVVLVLAQGKADLARAARRLATRVDALAVMGSAGLPEEAVTSLAEIRPVVVLAGDPVPGTEAVSAENTQSATRLTEGLLRAGRRRLLFVGDPRLAVDVAERFAGFEAAHTAARRRTPPPVPVAFDEDGGYAAAETVLGRRTRPDAVVCANDLLALALMERLQDAGVDIPGDVAVTGWDDVLAARYVRPALTTVRQPVRELAALAATRLHARVGGDPGWGGVHRLRSEVVVRDSSPSI